MSAMAMRTMTFKIPEDVAVRFENQVPPSEQSEVVTQLLSKWAPRRELTEAQWEEVCCLANNDPETQAIQREMAALPDTMTEEWHDDSVAVSQTR